MNNIFEALTSNGTLSSCGIKNINVFYDTLVTNIKTTDRNEYVLLDKIDFNYTANIVESEKNSIILNFGNTESNIPNNTNGNCYVDSVLHEKEKILFICGLSSLNTISQNRNGVIHTAKAMTPVIYMYDVNEHSVKKLFPTDNAWTTQVFGNITNDANISVSFNPNTNKLNYFLICERSLSSVSTVTSGYFWIDVDLQFSQSEFILTDVKILSSGKINDVEIVANKSFNDQEKLLITNTNNDILLYSH
jgi:hypothetical protein